ncbi:MAG: hypothetical protein HY241_17050 [Actinobacteria bacterium]|nr:hypothetical protein [Actinomycetota bacterium]
MIPVTEEEFNRLLVDFERDAIHLETHDAYGTATELPYLAKWLAGQPDDLEWLQGWCAVLRGHVAAGRRVRRVRVVSEPLSDYQRWSFSIARPMVQAGEDIRWVPRSLVSSIAFPGNDFYLFDDHLVVFLLYAGDGSGTQKLASRDPADVALCRSVFDALWRIAVPHGAYRPSV